MAIARSIARRNITSALRLANTQQASRNLISATLNYRVKQFHSTSIARMSASKNEGFGGGIPAFKQDLPGNQEDMPGPKPESTRIEHGGKLYEYSGAVQKLKHQKVIVTGGDSGIGRSVAVLMAREGADITIVYLEEEQKDAETTKSMIEKEGRECLLIPFDLKNFRKCKDIIDKHMEKYGRLDVLVNNASKQHQEQDFANIDLDNVETSFQVNVIQMFAMCKYAVPHMKPGSSIIMTTSVVAERGSDKMIDYASTKGAIVSFTRSLSKNLVKKHIRGKYPNYYVDESRADEDVIVNAVAPGPVHTPIQPASRSEDQMEGFGEGTTFGRPGQPSEIASSFIFLASSEGNLYNGQILQCYALGD